jgi:hypothetical protein
MMREKQYSRDDDISSYIQLRNHNPILLKSKQSFFTYIRFYPLVFVLLFLTSCILFPLQNPSDTYLNNRLKRQITNINDKQHYVDMLRRIILHRTSSSVLADCTINMDVDGIYRQPSENSISIQVIHLIEQSFEKEIFALKQTAEKIRNNLRQNSNSLTELTLDRFRNEFNLDLRILLASQIRIKEIHIRLIPYDNGGSYTIKYFRKKNSLTNIIDHESIHDDIIQQDHILQTFTVSNIRETLSNDPQRILTTNGWWLGPVICEKNKNEAYIMAHILPLRNDYILVTYFNISSVDINQCANNDVPFGGTHKCSNSMEVEYEILSFSISFLYWNSVYIYLDMVLH